MSRLALYLLGPPRVELDGEPVHIGRRKALALFAYLAVTPGSHRRDTLATLLWPDYDQRSSRAHLRRALVSLTNRLGGEWFVADRETIGINPDAALWVDVLEFRKRIATSGAHGRGHAASDACPDCLALLTEAVELYRDGFMAGFSLPDSLPFDDWQRHQTEALRDDLGSVLERLSACHAALGEYEPAIAAARRWLELDPWQEEAHRRLMRLLAVSGERSAALAQYETCRRLLRAELGVEPATETARLYERIRDGEIAAGEAPQVVLHNLPVSLVPMVGRERELAEIAKRLADPTCRLLTLIGPGGCGKTRLAVEAAATQIGTSRHGVYFVSLAPLQAAEAIVPAVAQALDFSFYTPTQDRARKDVRQQLLDYLREKHLLLLLDSFEHLLARPSAPSNEWEADGVNLVADVLRTARDVKILVTSRVRLNARGEHLFPVPGMDVPEAVPIDTSEMANVAEFGGVKLFLQAAHRARLAFEPTADDLAHIVHICRLVHGMPLAILLAASWTGVLPPDEIAAQIADETGSGIDFLVTDWGDVPQRQKSMRAVLDHSWRLLNRRQREVFQALSVFRGGFAREAAQHVTGASLTELRELADRSLLHPTPSGRYEVHELVRQ